MSARETWRWIVFSLTGRVPGQAHGGNVTERRVVGAEEAAGLGLTAQPGAHDDYEAMTGHAVTCGSGFGAGCQCGAPPTTAEQRDAVTGPLTAALGGGRTAKVIAHTLGTHGYSLAAVHGMSDAELLAVPGIGETSLTWIREHVLTPRCRGCGQAEDKGCVCLPPAANWHREERRLIAECRDTDDCCAVDACRLDAHRLLPHSDTVPVPRDALRRLVEVARQVAASEPYPDPVPARDALAALDDAGLLDQLKEEN